MSRYVGARHDGNAIVSVVHDDNWAQLLDPGYRYVNHSPSGFEWGYMGSGPAQLAFAVLLNHFGSSGQALLFYQDFKEHVIAALTEPHWELTTEQIEQALEQIRIYRTRARTEASWHTST